MVDESAIIKILPETTVFVSGAVGSALSLRFLPDLTRWQRITSIIGGTIIAGYLAEPVADYFEVEKAVGAVGFLFGLFGLSICAKLFETIKSADPWGLIESRFGGGEK